MLLPQLVFVHIIVVKPGDGNYSRVTYMLTLIKTRYSHVHEFDRKCRGRASMQAISDSASALSSTGDAHRIYAHIVLCRISVSPQLAEKC